MDERITLDLAAAANILNALVSLINENTSIKAVLREQQALLQPGAPQSPDEGESNPEGED
jgi:hypothetical protein